MAKQISPVNVWVNGESKEAKYLQVMGINDNYESSATGLSAGDIWNDGGTLKIV